MSPLLQGADPARLPLPVPSAGAWSPMDVACRRVLRTSRRAPHDEFFEYLITVPNPRYPLPAPPLVRHHGDGRFAELASWGAEDGDTQAHGRDLALSVMAAYLPFRLSEHRGAMRARDGTLISARAEHHHLAFHEEFLRPLPAEGGLLRHAAVREWIAAREHGEASATRRAA